MSLSFIPASLLLEDIGVWPADVGELEGGLSVLDRIGIRDVSITESAAQTTAALTLVFRDELAFTIPGLSDISLVLGGVGENSEFRIELDLREPVSLRLVDVSFALRFASSMLRPVRPVNEHFEFDPSGRPVQIAVTATIIVDNSGLRVEGMDEITLDPFMIGETGIVIEARSLLLDLSKESNIPQAQIAGLPLSWVGVFIPEATIHMPRNLGAAVPAGLSFHNAAIGSGGFTGQIQASWDPAFGGSIGGVQFLLRSFALDFRQNSFSRSEIKGTLRLPFFNEPVDVEIGINADSSLAVKLTSENGLYTLTKSEHSQP